MTMWQTSLRMGSITILEKGHPGRNVEGSKLIVVNRKEEKKGK